MDNKKNFIDDAPYWQVILFGSIFGALIVFGLFTWMAIDTTGDASKLMDIRIRMAIGMGIFSGLFVAFSVSMMRASKKFWDMAREVESKVDQAKTRAELDIIDQNDFKALSDQASGTIHVSEYQRLVTMLVTKYRLIE